MTTVETDTGHRVPGQAGELTIQQLIVQYDPHSAQRAVDDVSLEIGAGEFVTLLGPSGCGKTTILRTVAGFVSPTSGQVFLDGKDLLSVPPNQRPVSMVFQSYALFPHMTVAQNVGYGLKAAGTAARARAALVTEALATMGLSGYADRAPGQLSGGQQQRVALARAMVTRPQVMLFDEPLSNLDASLREQMRLEIRRLQRRLGTTAVYVTHDQSEAMAMSDRVVVLNAGRVEQVGTPAQTYRYPASRFVAEFVGRANLVPVMVTEWDEGQAEVEIFGSRHTVPAHLGIGSARRVELLVRPESMRLRAADAQTPNTQRAEVVSAVFMGDRIDYELIWQGQRLLASVMDPDDEQILTEGSMVEVGIEPARTWLLPAEPSAEPD